MNLALRASVSRRWKESVVKEGGGKKFAKKTHIIPTFFLQQSGLM